MPNPTNPRNTDTPSEWTHEQRAEWVASRAEGIKKTCEAITAFASDWPGAEFSERAAVDETAVAWLTSILERLAVIEADIQHTRWGKR